MSITYKFLILVLAFLCFIHAQDIAVEMDPTEVAPVEVEMDPTEVAPVEVEPAAEASMEPIIEPVQEAVGKLEKPPMNRLNFVLYAGLIALLAVGVIYIKQTSKPQPNALVLGGCRAILACFFAWAFFGMGALALGGRTTLIEYCKHSWPEVTEPFFERQFDDGCSTRTEMFVGWLNGEQGIAGLLHENLDGYVFAHTVGWCVGAMIVVRDPWLAWSISLTHEVYETTFRGVYPPFAECWWDQLILDIGGNTLGALLVAPVLMRVFGLERRSYWSSYPVRLVYPLAWLAQLSIFPVSFWLPHVMGIPPKHTLSVFQIYVQQAVVNMLMLNSIWNRLSGTKGDTFRWEFVFTGLLFLQASVVLRYNDACDRPLNFVGWDLGLLCAGYFALMYFILAILPKLGPSAKAKEE